LGAKEDKTWDYSAHFDKKMKGEIKSSLWERGGRQIDENYRNEEVRRRVKKKDAPQKVDAFSGNEKLEDINQDCSK